MKLLAIDTSTDYLSIAVCDGGKVLGRFHRKADMSHSSLLVPMIDRALGKARFKLRDIDGFCISAGPGSFTGLRIGVVTIKALAYSVKKPVAAVPTLDAIAQNAVKFTGVVCPVLDARKNKVYGCLYRSDGRKLKKISKYLLLPAGDLSNKIKEMKIKDIMLLGNASGQVTPEGAVHFKKDWHPRAGIVAMLGLEILKREKSVAPEDLEPMYMYSKECDIKGV
ncbi:MAG: tRNA (adenosine(37)-N6)-threonylcarbamoyltransferase complex dimerization subunit type 1 TsaB [Candidatus Omnitrophota bacterium]